MIASRLVRATCGDTHGVGASPRSKKALQNVEAALCGERCSHIPRAESEVSEVRARIARRRVL